MDPAAALVTTDYVVDEILTLLRFRLGLHAAEQWWELISGSPRVRQERVDSDCTERARGIFFRCRDKDFSFTDCTSFAFMREMRVRKALATDRQFRQAGFQIAPDSR